MFTAILWDYDGTLANTPVKHIAVTRAVLGRLDPALLDPLPEALSSLAMLLYYVFIFLNARGRE